MEIPHIWQGRKIQKSVWQKWFSHKFSTFWHSFHFRYLNAPQIPFSLKWILPVILNQDFTFHRHTNNLAKVVLKCSNYVKLGELEVVTPRWPPSKTFFDMIRLSRYQHTTILRCSIICLEYELYTVIYHVLNLNKYWFHQMCRILWVNHD